MENQKMKVNTLRKVSFQLKYGHMRGKNNEKSLAWSIVAKLLQKNSKCNLGKTLQYQMAHHYQHNW